MYILKDWVVYPPLMIFLRRSSSFNISSRREDNPAPPPPPAATGAADAEPETIGAVGGLFGGGLIPGGPFMKEGCTVKPGGAAPGLLGGSFGGGGNPEGDLAGALGGALGGPECEGGALGGPDRKGGPGGADTGAAAGAVPPPVLDPDNMLKSKFAAFSRAS